MVFTLALCAFFEKREAGTDIYEILFASPLADLVVGIVVTVLTIPSFKNLNTTGAASAIVATHPGTVVMIACQHGTCGNGLVNCWPKN